MPLHLDYRPKSLDELVGNKAVKDSLKTIFAIARKDRPHSYLLTGPAGCGKTTVGRIIKNMLGCSDYDFLELNSANSRGIDTIREITVNCHYSPIDGLVKVYLLDECHQFSGAAAEALLKILEDTPSHVYFILCTTEPEKLKKTIHTRCSTYMVSSLSDKETRFLLQSVLDSEKVTDFSEKVLDEIVKVAEGCPRQALVILDQVIDILDDDEAIKAVSTIKFEEAEVIDICRGLYQKESWETMRHKVKLVTQNIEPEKIRYAILGYMTTILLSKKRDDRASEIIDMMSENTFYSGKAGLINNIYILSFK